MKLVFKNFPLRNHKFARPAAIAALAANKQGKFWELHDQLYKNYNKLNEQKIREIAQQVGLFILILLMILVFYNDITRIFFS